MGYGGFMKFDHDFIGREALEKMSNDRHRNKVTLALDDDDVTRVIGSTFQKHNRAKFIDWPSAVYSMHPFDRVIVDGKTVGISTWIGYTANEGKMLTLAVLDADYAEPGTEVIFVWGEEDGGSAQADGRARTCRRTCARSSARCRTRKWRARPMRRAAGERPSLGGDSSAEVMSERLDEGDRCEDERALALVYRKRGWRRGGKRPLVPAQAGTQGD